jgi:hypothetical protein
MQSDVDGAATSCGSRALEQRPVSCSERCAVSESVMLREKDPGCVNRCSHVSLSTKQQENEAGRTPRKPIGYIMPHLTRLEEGRTKINSQRNTGSRERCLPFRQCVDPHRARCVLYTPHRTRYEQPTESPENVVINFARSTLHACLQWTTPRGGQFGSCTRVASMGTP